LKKVVYIVSDIEKALAFEWLSVTLKQKFELVFILIGKNESALMHFLKAHGVRSYQIEGTLQFAMKWVSVFNILRAEKPDVVHTHLWTANLIGLSASWLLRIRKRIFTRHHAMIHHTQYPSGLKWDKACNWLATDIIAISENIKTILIKYDGARESKIHLIHHGFDLEYFADPSADRVAALKKKYDLKSNYFPVVGVISRYVKWKGVQFMIQAFKELRKNFPQAHLILANADGDYRDTIQSMLTELPKGCYTEIVFEEDLSALYKLFHVYVHVPTDDKAEAFGQTYVEALAAGIPSVFTRSGIGNEFLVHEENALVVDYQSSEQIAAAVDRILRCDDLRNKLISNGHGSVAAFELNNMLNRLVKLYE
jgi:glycosyltransferase involved in cell wall biosynthesis